MFILYTTNSVNSLIREILLPLFCRRKKLKLTEDFPIGTNIPKKLDLQGSFEPPNHTPTQLICRRSKSAEGNRHIPGLQFCRTILSCNIMRTRTEARILGVSSDARSRFKWHWSPDKTQWTYKSVVIRTRMVLSICFYGIYRGKSNNLIWTFSSSLI